MTNLLPFNYPHIGQTESKNVVDSNISHIYKARKVSWTSLLGKSNEELEIDILVNSPAFMVYVETVRKDFIKNYADSNEYPKFDEKDWD